MVLNIEDPETDRLARELAAATGESITTGVRRAIEERLSRVSARARSADARSVIDDIIATARAEGPRGPDRLTDDEILGYGPDGLPT